MFPLDYSKVIDLFDRYVARFQSAMAPQEKQLAGEMRNKLAVLRDVSREIVDLTNQIYLVARLTPNENDEITLGGMTIKLNRADPDKPVQLAGAVRAYAEHPDRPGEPQIKDAENQLRRRAEEFYVTAHRITHIAGDLPGLASFKAPAIRIVRNQLMEHPEGANSGVTFDSFAYDMLTGPIIKGVRIDNQLQHMDKGFKPNAEEFLSNLERCLEGAVAST
ncbi:MAG TPA: hypothetical protein VGO52_25785 [Hyphomonadaceae bacterium]|nr:hypothetical protein [Hyphomonadaceae bacterium]